MIFGWQKILVKSNQIIQKVIAELEEVAAGAITVELESKKIEDFDEYMFRYNFAVIHAP